MKSSVEHKMSTLLSREENEQVFRLFGSKCQSLATSVVQLYLTQSPEHARWIKRDTGVLCFIKDNVKRNYFFRLYCPNRSKMLWEQELYINLDYKCPQDYFHTFEADDCLAGMNFATEEEAVTMKNVILEKLALKRQRREERRSRNSLQSRQSTGSGHQITNKQQFHSNASITSDKYPSSQPNSFPSYSSAQSAKKKKRHITKDDIGLPCDFVHISHVGWDATKGFDINVDDPNLLKFFSKAGVSDRQLRDKDTRDFIYDFINTHGGLDAVKNELTDPGSLKLPPLPKNTNQTHTPPPVPARTPVNRSAPPPPPPNKTKPPPVRGQPPPRPDTIPMAVHSIPEPPPLSTVPAPPPPPPPMNNFVAPPPPVMMLPEAPPPTNNNNINNQGADPRSALLESIRAGRNLKPVEVEPKAVAAPDSRGNLLSEIRQGIELKPVTSNASRPSSGPSGTENSLAEALSNALRARAFAIHSESESDSGNSTDDEDEWEQDE